MSLLTLDQFLSQPLLPSFRRREGEGEEEESGARKSMYLAEKPRPVDYYKEEARDMMIQVVGNGGLPQPQPQPQQQLPQPQQPQQMIFTESSREDHVRPPPPRLLLLLLLLRRRRRRRPSRPRPPRRPRKETLTSSVCCSFARSRVCCVVFGGSSA